MLDSLPNEFWKQQNLKILDSCCGNGNFHAYAALKTKLKIYKKFSAYQFRVLLFHHFYSKKFPIKKVLK